MIRFKVAPDGGTEYEVTATARDVLAWERQTKGTFAQLQANQRMTDLYRIAYLASKRHGLFDGSASEFESTCDLTDLTGNADEDQAGDADPTRSAQ